MKKIGPWTQKSSKIVYQNKWLKVREDEIIHPDGKDGIYSVVETHPAVFIVALNDKNEILLNKQFRYTTEIDSWEIPAGSTDGKDKLESAKRELLEETGYTSKSIVGIGSFQSANGFASEIGYTFLARDLEFSGSSKLEEEGISEVSFFSIKKVNTMIKQGHLTDAVSITPIYQALIHINHFG